MPDQVLRCLLVNPEFRTESFWSFTAACELKGAKSISPPLGLLTVAAILPQHWEFRLADLNVRPLSQEDWDWADLVCTGGMLPQQPSVLELIDRAVAEDKYIVVGGADPSSEPQLYSKAHTLIVGEGEEVIPLWLDSWRSGNPGGVFKENAKPDITTSPTPRFDLIELSAYLQINIQYSRGCPFNCEFCDIIELYGRRPRTKTSEQICKELDALLAIGYSGEVFIVDDNFIGNKVNLTRHLLPGLIEWNRKNGYPFYYTTEASLNLMDDESLMKQMREAEFRSVFFGIETPDPDVLRITQKKQNSYRPILERIHKLYDHGMVAYGGFILGLDGEKDGVDDLMIELIEDACINIAMVGLLVALPNTQLTRRLLKERRLLNLNGDLIHSEEEMFSSADHNGADAQPIDQTMAGLNFRTQRSRQRIMEDLVTVVSTVYEPKRYFDRLLRLSKRLKVQSRHRPRAFEIKRDLAAFMRLTWAMTRDGNTRYYFWRNLFAAIPMGAAGFSSILNLMGAYVHFKQQVRYTISEVTRQIPVHAETDRRLAESAPAPPPAELIILAENCA
jgi:radical SAM superfamily enzyme YgiQ (UPF0313 family)